MGALTFDGRLLTNAVLGLAVGDALGMPYETGKRGTFDIREDTHDGMRGFRKGMPAWWYESDLPPGTWTDDTAMVLAEMESIARLGRIDLDDLMRSFCRWYDDGAFTPHGQAIGAGRRTVASLERYRSGMEPLRCGGAAPEDNGNGSLMRMLPFVFLPGLMARSGVTVRDVSAITHAHPIAVKACEIYVDFARRLMRGEGKSSAAASLAGHGEPFDRLGSLVTLPEQDILSTGYVVHSLEAALWSFLTTDSYEECVLTAVQLGGDTDTNAAIAGSLAALCYPVPEKWIAQLQGRESILRACEALAQSLIGAGL